MEILSESKVEASFKKRKIHGFLEDLIELCIKHGATVDTDIDTEETMIEFLDWDCFTHLEVNFEGASLYWPRIQTDIVLRRKDEQRKSKEDC